uniref:Uncharacterized protein n=1 Tax=Romanomermis culicivorax TaxID=13658 RepID=A0A915IEC0_ROMCU
MAADRDLTDHKQAALDKSLLCHTDQQKLDFTMNKTTAKTYVTAAQKSKALSMLCQNRDVFSLPGDKPTFTNELTININMLYETQLILRPGFVGLYCSLDGTLHL